MPQLSRGRIVWVELLDPQGRNRKCRPAVIVTPDADLREDGDLWVVAITSQLDALPADDVVELPWDSRGHPRTGLKERCAAVCTWMEKVNAVDIRSYAGIVPGGRLLEIMKRINPPDEATMAE